ncbi:MAG: ribulose-phosphate 3-epimerase [Clostridiales bacterium]|jgi:ribulose-phosphate 3-epimerase|nr:ribulose-phosphate 3-epimerase [Clostridiales bacterium]
MVKIAPSILSADFANLERDLHAIERAGADMAHVDVMDGVFVPNITIGIPVVASIRRVTSLPLDVHLMITQPHRYVERFAGAGADYITVHYESETDENISRSIELIHRCNAKAGLSIKPETPAAAVLPWLSELDLVLVMTVEPGFGGQHLIEAELDKVRALRGEISRRRLSVELEVDGGVNARTAGSCALAGADILVAGSAVFGSDDMAGAISALRCQTPITG